MKEQEARAFLEEIRKYGSVPGLDSVRRLLEELGNPQEKLRVVHIAGTNGKGSILAMIESVLQESGYRTGRYHSPVLFDVREAFEVNRNWISVEDFCKEVEKVKNAAEYLVKKGHPHPTSFEVETAIAFCYFLDQKVDVVLLETGMGGRLDATNIISKPIVEILASISMDHMNFLGNSIEEITREKAGIIKANSKVILYPSSKKIYDVVLEKAEEESAILTMANAENVRILSQNTRKQSFSYLTSTGHFYEKISIQLLGDHQIYNAITAIEALEAMKCHFCMSSFEIEEGMRKATWSGRLEQILESPIVIRDGAHNEDAALHLAKYVEKNFTNKRIFYIIGVLADKEYEKILKIMSPYAEDVFAIASDSPRALPAEDLAECAKKYYTRVEVSGKLRKAMEEALSKADKDDVIILFGSLSFMKEIEELQNDGTLPKSSNS